jgi:XamI restriction endonuclease
MATLVRWTPKQLAKDAEIARANFRTTRLSEQALYQNFAAEYDPFFRELIPHLTELHDGTIDRAWLIEFLFDNQKALDAFRYLAAPRISADDLEALSATTIRATTFRADAKAIDPVVNVVGQLLDPIRFPWAAVGMKPTAEEIERAVIASTTLIATQRVETHRRNDSKDVQETLVKDTLRALHFKEVKSRPMKLITDAPNPMEFCGQAKLGTKQGDVFARLADKRLLAIECKVSNSEVNSFKRVMNDSVSKAVEWIDALGKNQVIPVAVIRGVFNPANLDSAQDNISLIWDHRLSDLSKFIKGVGPATSAGSRRKR